VSKNEKIAILQCWKRALHEVKTISSLGFCLSHLEILLTIYLEDGITRNELKRKMSISSTSTLKRYVKDLINEYGYINESESENDCRIKRLHISETGQEIIDILITQSKYCATQSSNQTRAAN